MKAKIPETGGEPELAAKAVREEQLAKVLNELVERLERGDPVDIDEVTRQHTDLACELRELWAAAQLAHDLGRTSSDPSSPDDASDARLHARAPTDGMIKQRIVGDYELLEEIGRGGMGVVYRAHQISLNRIVALKMILTGELASAADLARFRAEAESAGRLDLPNIVPVYAVSDHEGRPYFTMKIVEGTTLARRLAGGPMPAREAAELLAPVCRAIHAAHQRGVLHRDLKPSNILIDRDSQPHITDFGLAKRMSVDGSRRPDESSSAAVRLDTLTRAGAILGTPSYMPPEQAAGNRGQLGPASDVYSLGAILYHMLTGRPPFQAATAVDTLLQVLEQDPLPPRLLNPQADRELEMIALKCLQKPPDLRYSTASAVADDLDKYLAGEPISARSGTMGAVISRVFRETHHAAVLENWGLLWMWHSLVLVVLCVATDGLRWKGIESRWPYVAIWTLGLGAWATVFWWLRQRSGPVTFVERQIAHVWGGSMAASALLFVVEALLGFPVLTLSPVLPLIGGFSFVVKAGILSGTFYFQACALFLTSALMCLFPSISVTIYGLVSAGCFFVPGLKYYWQVARRS